MNHTITHMDLKNDGPLLITVSGGRSSAFMSILLNERFPEREKLFVFANTGREREETLIFLNKLELEFKLQIIWLEAVIHPDKGNGTSYKIVNFKTANRTGKPFEQLIKKYGLPSRLYRHCTRELKLVPIHKYAKAILGNDYQTAIGIRADEGHRVKVKGNFIYPLDEMNIDQCFINDWWQKQSFNLNLKEHEGNCDFCFLKSERKRVRLIREGLDVDWWNYMEKKYTTDRQPMFDVRNNMTIENLIRINNEQSKQLSFFDNTDFDCVCKST